MRGLLGHGRSATGYRQLADLLAERHQTIGNNWQNASTAQLVARYLRRAAACTASRSPASVSGSLAIGLPVLARSSCAPQRRRL